MVRSETDGLELSSVQCTGSITRGITGKYKIYVSKRKGNVSFHRSDWQRFILRKKSERKINGLFHLVKCSYVRQNLLLA